VSYVKERGLGFSIEHLITVNAAWEKKQYVFREGHRRIQAFRELGYQRMGSIIKAFNGEEEVVEDAKWGALKTTGIEARGIRDSS